MGDVFYVMVLWKVKDRNGRRLVDLPCIAVDIGVMFDMMVIWKVKSRNYK